MNLTESTALINRLKEAYWKKYGTMEGTAKFAGAMSSHLAFLLESPGLADFITDQIIKKIKELSHE